MFKNLAVWLVIGLVLMTVFNQFNTRQVTQASMEYSQFMEEVGRGSITKVVIEGRVLKATTSDGRKLTTYAPPDLWMVSDLLKHGVKVEAKPEEEQSFLMNIFISWFPMLLLIGVWVFFMRQMQGGGKGGAFSFGKSKARLLDESTNNITFADVAGCDEAKEEVAELVDFLRDPSKFQKLGGRIPKGVLLVGNPGTGKTLLAKAIAGEAKVPFFSISGSDFVEMFVGVGAARVRDMFENAKKHSPCIIFIDELDAIGKARGNVMVGGHDEREQTLNQLLVEMDGFDPSVGVVILAATNRPETLDPALLRAGRFDRQVLVDRPDVNGREAILKIHAQKVKMAADVNLAVIARKTPGFSGADLANVVNEAALLAGRKSKSEVEMEDLDEAVDRIIAGLEKKNRVINPKEKEIVAYHETGHALVAAFTPGADAVHKISIIPRGIGALGYTQQLPTEDRYLMTRRELLGKIDVLLGGRMSEDVVFGEISTGAHNDLQRATEIARAMTLEYGMGKTLGLSTYPRQNRPMFLSSEQAPFIGKEYSEATAAKLDEEVKELITERAVAVKELLSQKRALLDRIASELLHQEVMESERFNEIIGGTAEPGIAPKAGR